MKKVFHLLGLDCVNCASKIEKAVTDISGVQEASLNFTLAKMHVQAEKEDMPHIADEIKKIVNKFEPDVEVV